MNLKKLQLEKVNMKVVIGIGIGLIVVLTAMFIIFKTNLIFDNDNKEKEPDTNENGGNGSSNNGENGENEENEGSGNEPNVDPNNPDSGENGNGSNEGGNNNENDGDSGNGNSGNGSNSGNKEPNYDDMDEDYISDEAKDRTKDKDELTLAEKEYIFQENVSKDLGKVKNIQKDCEGNTVCKVDVSKYNQYTSKKDKIEDCTGKVLFTYNKKKKKLEFDMSEIKCGESV